MSSALSSVGSLVGGIFGGPVGASIGGFAGNLLGGSSNSGAQGAIGSQSGANQAANALLSQLQGNIGNIGDVAQQLQNRYNTASPMEGSVLNFLYNQAFPGLSTGAPGSAPGTTAYNQVPMMTDPNSNGGQPYAGWGARRTAPGATVSTPANPAGYGGTGAPNQAGMANAYANAVLGIYNSTPYALARQAAENSNNQNAINLGHDYTNNLQGHGLQNSSLMTGGQSNIVANAGKNYSDFVRNLGINAVTEENNRVNQLNAALQPSLGSLVNAGQAYNSAGGLGNNTLQTMTGQLNTLNQGAGQAMVGANNGLGQLGTLLGGGGSSNSGAQYGVIPDYNASNDVSTGIDQSTGSPIGAGYLGPAMPHAHGGFVPAGQTTLTGERGPETFVPAKTTKEGTINIPHSIFAMWLHHTMTGGKGGDQQPQTQQPAVDPMMAFAHMLALMPHRAMGGQVGGNQPYVVGEHGPEVIVPQQSGYIIPHSPSDLTPQSAASLSGLDPAFARIYKMYSGA